MLNDERDNLVEAADQLGKFSALTVDTVNQTKENLVKELRQIGPVLESLANAGPSLTRSLEPDSDLPVPERDHRKMAARRLCQPHGDRRPDAQPHRLPDSSPEPGGKAT